MGKLQIDVQFWPWNSTPELVSYAAQALSGYPYGYVWMCDEFQYEDPFTTLAAMALQLDISVGTMITFPWRNPLDLAQRFASIAKLTQPGRGVAVGFGTGGAVQVQVTKEKAAPVAVMRESIQLLRGLLAGESVELSRFPRLGDRFLYNPENRAKLYFPPPQPVPVYVGCGGPRMYDVAGSEADGAIFSQLVPRTCHPAAQSGHLRQGVEAVEAARARTRRTEPFVKLYASHISVSRDGRAAKDWAKRNTSYGLANAYLLYPEVLVDLDFDPEEAAPVAAAYTQGLGVDEAARRISDHMLWRAGFVFAGTPDECIGPYLDLKHHLEQLGFDRLVIGVPLGPNIPEALELINKEVLPTLVD